MEFPGHSPTRKSRSFGRRCNPWLALGCGGSGFRAIRDLVGGELKDAVLDAGVFEGEDGEGEEEEQRSEMKH